MAGLGLGLLSRFIPTDGKIGGALSGASQGASMGAMFGPWGMGIGAALGGITGLFTGGKAKKNARNAETSQVFEQFSSKEFIEIQKQADKFGISMDKALSAKTMKDFSAAVDEVNAKLTTMNDLQSQIDDLTAQATVGFDEMNAVVKEFGLDISKMGPAFQQAAMDKEAQKIIDAFAIMEKGGADMNGVLDGMQDEISKVVQDSLKFGTTIPENMKPWIEKLRESGKLVDENGEKITDTSKLKFGTPMASEMDKVVLKLDELIQKLADLTKGFQDAGTAAGDLGSVTYPNVPDGSSGSGNNETPGFATGGVAGRDFRRPGHGDIFPALLRRGERVLPPGASGGGMSLSIGNLTVGGGYGSRAEAVEEIGDAVVEYLERRGARLVA
jgi:gas vesicle protein